MIDSTLAHYKISGELGRGGMGVVYRAHDTKLNRPVALKVLPALELASTEDRIRFEREAQAAAQLNHPNIATIYEIGDDNGRPYIAMELIEGRTLAEYIEDGSLSIHDAERISAQLADGLGAAHAKDIVHRDIKSANVMVNESGRVKILDFGLAKMASSVDVTQEGSTVGTYGYMSPEQLRGEEATAASDAWSFGIIMYELLAGKRPFEAAYEAALSFQILNEEPVALEEVNPDVGAATAGIVARLLLKEPDQRLSSMHEVVEALGGAGSAVSSIRAKPSRAPSKSISIQQLGIGVGAIALIALAAWFIAFRPGIADVPEARSGIAVVPFSVDGDETIAHFGNAVSRLLSTKLDDSGAIRSVDYNSVVGYVDREDSPIASTAAGIGLTDFFEAEGFILGNVLRIAGPIVISATLYTTDGTVEAEAEASVAHDSLLMGAVDDIGRQLLAGRLDVDGDLLRSTAALTSHSFEALNKYLEGEVAVRDGRHEDAYASYTEAVEIDSTFTLAWYRLARTIGWTDEDQSEIGGAIAKALSGADRLPDRIRRKVEIVDLRHQVRLDEAERELRALTREYPDDADNWFQLGDLMMHQNVVRGRSFLDAEEPLSRALRLDPGNNEGISHISALAFLRGDYNKIDSLDAIVGRQTFSNSKIIDLVRDLDLNTDVALDSLRSRASKMSLDTLLAGAGAFIALNPRPSVLAVFTAEVIERARAGDVPLGNVFQLRAMSLLAVGKIDEAWKLSVEVRDQPGGYYGWTTILMTYLPYAVAAPDSIFENLWQDHVNNFSRWSDSTFQHREVSDQMIWYRTLGAMAVRRNDLAAVDSISQRLEQFGTTQGQNYANTLRAFRALADGNAEEALVFADKAIISRRLRDSAHYLLSPSSPIEAKTEAHYALGQYDHAARWLRAVLTAGLNSGLDMSTHLIRSPRLTYLLAKSEHALGNTDEALLWYQRYIQMFKGADERYQGDVEDARKEVSTILQSMSAEAGS